MSLSKFIFASVNGIDFKHQADSALDVNLWRNKYFWDFWDKHSNYNCQNQLELQIKQLLVSEVTLKLLLQVNMHQNNPKYMSWKQIKSTRINVKRWPIPARLSSNWSIWCLCSKQCHLRQVLKRRRIQESCPWDSQKIPVSFSRYWSVSFSYCTP